MTKEEMIELARQAGFERLGHTAEDWVCHLEDIEEFIKLVAEKAIKEALAQPEQEPLAWISTGPANMIHWTADKPAYGDDWVPLYTTPPQRTWVGDLEDIDINITWNENSMRDFGKDELNFARAILGKAQDGYVAPQRTWVGLTNGEMIELSEMKLGSWDLILEVG